MAKSGLNTEKRILEFIVHKKGDCDPIYCEGNKEFDQAECPFNKNRECFKKSEKQTAELAKAKLREIEDTEKKLKFLEGLQ